MDLLVLLFARVSNERGRKGERAAKLISASRRKSRRPIRKNEFLTELRRIFTIIGFISAKDIIIVWSVGGFQCKCQALVT